MSPVQPDTQQQSLAPAMEADRGQSDPVAHERPADEIPERKAEALKQRVHKPVFERRPQVRFQPVTIPMVPNRNRLHKDDSSIEAVVRFREFGPDRMEISTIIPDLVVPEELFPEPNFEQIGVVAWGKSCVPQTGHVVESPSYPNHNLVDHRMTQAFVRPSPRLVRSKVAIERVLAQRQSVLATRPLKIEPDQQTAVTLNQFRSRSYKQNETIPIGSIPRVNDLRRNRERIHEAAVFRGTPRTIPSIQHGGRQPRLLPHVQSHPLLPPP